MRIEKESRERVLLMIAPIKINVYERLRNSYETTAGVVLYDRRSHIKRLRESFYMTAGVISNDCRSRFI